MPLRLATFAPLAALAGLAAALPAHAELIYGMTAVNSISTSPGLGLVSFDSATPGTLTSIGSFSGVVAGHAVRSIDFRPATGELWAISSATANFAQAQLYTVNLSTAALTPVGAGLALAGNTSARVEIDFNPVVDRIRIVTGGTTGNNFRANPNTGALVQADTDLARAPGDMLTGQSFSIVAAAYTNNFAGATSTTLYGYDWDRSSLVTIGGIGGVPSPNGGQVFSISNPGGFLLGGAGAGMDISGTSGVLYIAHDDPFISGAPARLFSINLATGAETVIGTLGGSQFVVDISVAIAPVPEPATWAMGAMGLAGLALYRRRGRVRDLVA